MVIQTNLPGIWRRRTDGCPHLHRGEIDHCDFNKMRPCLYEIGETCEVFMEIIKEWEKEIENG